MIKKEDAVANIDEQILRATKEIVVKFIENGRISPSGFHETFESIYHTVEKTAKASAQTPPLKDPTEKVEKGKGKSKSS